MWEAEAAQHYGWRAHVLYGVTPPQHNPAIPYRPRLYILNYDILYAWVDWLRARRPRCIILDEPQQAMLTPTARRAKAAAALCAKVPHVLGLSGTPLMNRPIELFQILQILRPDVWPSRVAYGWAYCEPRLNRGRWEYKGANNLPALHRQLREVCMVRRLKSEVLQELPPKLRRVVPIELTDYSEYYEARDNYRNWLLANHPTRARRALWQAALTQLGYLLRLCGKLKYQAVVQWVDDWLAAGDGKILLFAKHRAMVAALQKRYAGQCVAIHGGVPTKQRRGAVMQFQGDKRCRVFIGNEAATTGITLTAANTVGFTELYWRPGDHAQAAARCHRIGTTETIWENYLVARETIEVKLCGLLQRKQDTLNAVLDGGNAAPLDILDLLMHAIVKGTI